MKRSCWASGDTLKEGGEYGLLGQVPGPLIHAGEGASRARLPCRISMSPWDHVPYRLRALPGRAARHRNSNQRCWKGGCLSAACRSALANLTYSFKSSLVISREENPSCALLLIPEPCMPKAISTVQNWWILVHSPSPPCVELPLLAHRNRYRLYLANPADHLHSTCCSIAL